MKHCRKCNRNKPLSEFNRNSRNGDGYQSWCRTCSRMATADWKVKQGADYSKRLYSRYRESRIESAKRMRQKHRQATNARKQVGNATIAGWLKRQPCFDCNATDTEAHHEDYSRPFDLVWYCAKHHAERHKEIRKARSRDGKG